MRETIYRGKRKDNGEWVYGNLIKRLNYDELSVKYYAIQEITSASCHNFARVIPETIGQYTGLKDKNGNKIFEDDILKFGDRLARVIWHEHCGCWDCSFIKYTVIEDIVYEDRSPNRWRWNAEVVGNIIDNPEL